ncbi:hypothetical protein BLSTO_00770 [Blastocystis sp. subtype 1]
MATRLQEFFGSVPPCTVFYTVLCIAVYVVQLLFGGVGACAISAYAVIQQYEFYRIVTSAFTHLGLMHIVFNLMSFNSINRTLERKYGSVFMLYLILLFTVINGILYVLIFYLLSFLYYPLIAVSAAGFSGVIFSLLTVESYVVEADSLSVFGLFSVPRKWYAVVYLILMSVIMPGVSFTGHLCGVISGFLFVSGYLNWLLPMHCLVACERGFVGSLLKRSNAFVFIPELHEVITSSLSFRSMLELAYQGVKTVVVMVVVFAKNVLWFAFNSVFPPVLDEVTPPQPPSEMNSDIEARPAVLTAEEQRQQRLQALAARGIVN